MRAPVVVQSVSHRYTRDWAVREVRFELSNSGIIGLLGSNGAGKSTIMNIMCGVLYPTVGDVLIDGLSIRDQPIVVKGKLGFLPQQLPLYPELSVQEYLAFSAELRGVRKSAIRPAVQETMEKCGIAHYAKRLIGALSGGYRQRCGIAQAILHSPRLVVMDEPTNGLDPLQTLAIRDLIKEISSERTVLISTHILSDVEALCEEVKMISRGRIVFDGTFAEFADEVKPQSLIVVFGNAPERLKLEELPGVLEVESATNRKFRLRFSAGHDIVATVIEASSKHGLEVKEIYHERSSLESVFAQLANEDS